MGPVNPQTTMAASARMKAFEVPVALVAFSEKRSSVSLMLFLFLFFRLHISSRKPAEKESSGRLLKNRLKVRAEYLPGARCVFAAENCKIKRKLLVELVISTQESLQLFLAQLQVFRRCAG